MNTSRVTHQLQLNSWAERIRDQQQSGMSVKCWCELNNFSRHQFFYWKRQLREVCLSSTLPEIVPISFPSDCNSSSTCATNSVLPTAESPEGSATRATFATIAAQTHSKADQSIRLAINDVVIDIYPDTPDLLLRRVLKVVRDA